jgi:ribosomal protein S18 acetylase RimI-like enzyme
MKAEMDSFYRLTFRDAFRAGEAMADAFVDDPVWRKLFEGESNLSRKYQAFFEVPIRLCLRYGKVYATSANFEGIIACVPGRFSDITFWRFLRSGAFGCGMRMGTSAGKRMVDLKVLPLDRAKNSGGRPYMYLLLLGVKREHQGKGIGGSLLRPLMAECDAQNLPIFLETETEENVKMYEHFGFKLIKKITLEKLGLPMWEMMREAPCSGSEETRSLNSIK